MESQRTRRRTAPLSRSAGAKLLPPSEWENRAVKRLRGLRCRPSNHVVGCRCPRDRRREGETGHPRCPTADHQRWMHQSGTAASLLSTTLGSCCWRARGLSVPRLQRDRETRRRPVRIFRVGSGHPSQSDSRRSDERLDSLGRNRHRKTVAFGKAVPVRRSAPASQAHCFYAARHRRSRAVRYRDIRVGGCF